MIQVLYSFTIMILTLLTVFGRAGDHKRRDVPVVIQTYTYEAKKVRPSGRPDQMYTHLRIKQLCAMVFSSRRHIHNRQFWLSRSFDCWIWPLDRKCHKEPSRNLFYGAYSRSVTDDGDLLTTYGSLAVSI